jgi:TonB family protein
MSPEQVRALLGEPDRIQGGAFTHWQYGGGYVTFFEGAVDRWSEPPSSTGLQDRAPLAWTDKIRAKIRGNIILPRDIPGNPEAIFDVTLLPSGEVLTVRKRKSSGHAGYDDAIERAIMKSSPLPLPNDRADFQGQLEIAFHPRDR